MSDDEIARLNMESVRKRQRDIVRRNAEDFAEPYPEPMPYPEPLARAGDAIRAEFERLMAENEVLTAKLAKAMEALEHVTELLVDTWATSMDGDPEQEMAVITAHRVYAELEDQ